MRNEHVAHGVRARRGGHRRGICHGGGARPFLLGGVFVGALFFLPAFLCGGLFFLMHGEKARRVCGFFARRVRALFLRCGGRVPYRRLRALGGDACGGGCAPARLPPVRRVGGACFRPSRPAAGDQRRFRPQQPSRARFAGARLFLRAGRARLFRAAFAAGGRRCGFVCGYEHRLFAPRPFGRGAESPPPRSFGGAGIRGCLFVRGLHPERRVPRGRRRARSCRTLPCRGGGREAAFCRGRVRRAHFARFFALSAPFRLCPFRRRAPRKKIRRGGSRAACGVCPLPLRACGRGAFFISRGGGVRSALFNVLRFSRVLSPKAPPKSTCPPQARRG